MNEQDLEQLLSTLGACRIDVRLDVGPQNRRMAYVYTDSEAHPGAHLESFPVNDEQTFRLMAAGARWVGPDGLRPAASQQPAA